MTAGLKKEGAIVINSSKSPAELRPLLKGYEGRVCTIDAGKISEEELGKNFPNTPMLAAIVREGRTIIPGGMTTIEPGDHVLVVTNVPGLTDLKNILA